MPTLRTIRARVRLANPQAPAPLPTQLQFYPPTTAALRPVSQVGRGLHRATDTGAIALWDGGAWRPFLVPPSGAPTGSLLVLTGSGWASLDPGAEGDVLRMSGGAPHWTAMGGGGGGDGGGDPPDSGLVARYAAQALLGLDGGEPVALPPGGTPVDAWVDALGGGVDLGQSDPGSRPTFLNPGGMTKPAVRFTDGKTLFAALAAVVGSGPRTVALIGTTWDATPGQTFLHAGDLTTAGEAFDLGTTSGDGHVGWQGGDTLADGSSNSLSGSPALLVLSFTGGNAVDLWHNGQRVVHHTSAGLNTAASDQFTLGGEVGAMDLYEVLVYAPALSDSDQLILAAYAAGEYGTPSP